MPISHGESILALRSANTGILILGPFRHKVRPVALGKGLAGVGRHSEIPMPHTHELATKSFDVNARQVGPMVFSEIAREARRSSQGMIEIRFAFE